MDQIFSEIKIKEDNKMKEATEQDIETSSGGSDSDPSDDDFNDEERMRIQGNILSVLENFYNYMNEGVP